MPVAASDEDEVKAKEGGDDVGEEAAILWPKFAHGQGRVTELKLPKGACSFRELPLPPVPAERPIAEHIPLPKSAWGRACLKAVEGQARAPQAGAAEEQSVAEWLQRLDLKLDLLSAQVAEALYRAGPLKRHGHTALAANGDHMCHTIWNPAATEAEADAAATEACLADVFPQAGREGSVISAFRNSRLVRSLRHSGAAATSGEGAGHRHRGSDHSVTESTTPSDRGSRHSMTAWIAKRQRRQGHVSRKVWVFLDNPESSCAAHLYNEIMPLFILLSVILSLVHAIAPTLLSGLRITFAELTVETIFFIETLLRFYVCPNRWKFFSSAYNIVDMLSVLPLFFRLALNDHPGEYSTSFEHLTLICFVPALRLLKTWRRFQQVHLLAKAFSLAFEALPVMLFIYMVVWLFFTAAVFVAEENTNIHTLGDAMWLTFCSLTSSAFGDVYPQTAAGKIIISNLVLISILYMAIPIGIIGSCFSEVWANRHKVLMIERMRRVFRQNGFEASDIPRLFSYFDTNNSGMLGLEEFTALASTLKLGLSEGRLITLFQLFDDDGSGGIDEQEFCRTFFPEEHSLLYGH